MYGLIHKVHSPNFLHCRHKRPTPCNNISDPRSEEWFELGNSDGHEEGEEGDEEERGEVVEGGGRRVEGRNTIYSRIIYHVPGTV